MTKLRTITLIFATFAGLAVSVALTSNAYACPGSYVRCGPGCCPTR
jgi:hypothetical protein